MLSLERQSARMSKITNDGLTRSGTGCFIAVPIWQQCASVKGLRYLYVLLLRSVGHLHVTGAHKTKLLDLLLLHRLTSTR